MKVYVVDDDPGTSDSLSCAFAHLQRFHDAESFLAEIDETVAESIVVANVHLPGISGFELIGELRARGFATPVVLVCDNADVTTAVRAIRCGAADFIEKPVPAHRVMRAHQRGDSSDRHARGHRLL